MSGINIVFLAETMIERYGAEAELVALGTAETHADLGEAAEMETWIEVARKIAELQPGQCD